MQIETTVTALQDGAQISGVQLLPAEAGEYILTEIFRHSSYRIIVDEVIDGNVCFRLMEGGTAVRFFVLKAGESASYSKECAARTGFGGAVIDFTDFTFKVF